MQNASCRKVAAKLQGDKYASFCKTLSARKVARRYISVPDVPLNFVKFMTHGFLHLSAFPDNKTAHAVE